MYLKSSISKLRLNVLSLISSTKPHNMLIPSISTKERRSKLIKAFWRNQNSLAPSSYCKLMAKGEEGKERGMMFTSWKPSAKYKKSERPWRLLRKMVWPSSKGIGLEIKFQLNSQESGRRKSLYSFIELSKKRMTKWKHWSKVWLQL